MSGISAIPAIVGRQGGNVVDEDTAKVVQLR